jgi:hypothetical protein
MEPAVCGPFHLTRPTDRVSIYTDNGTPDRSGSAQHKLIF